MKISEAIRALQKMKDTYGDIPIVLHKSGTELQDIRFISKGKIDYEHFVILSNSGKYVK